MTYAIDSNIISYYLKKNDDIRNRVIEETEKNNQFVIPSIVYYEVKRWLLEKQATTQMWEFDELCVKISIGNGGRLSQNEATAIQILII